MFNAIYGLFNNLIARHSSSFLSALHPITFIKTRLRLLWSIISNFIVNIFFTVVKFVLGVIDALEYIINSLLGIGSTIDDYTEYAQSIRISGNRDYLKTLVKTFRAIVGVALVLLLIFTIIAIIKQEVNTAKNGFEPADSKNKSGVANNKGGIIMRLFKNLLAIVALPVTMIFIIAGVNSILTAFNTALKGEDSNTTLGGQVLAASTYDANKYRMYANAGKRIPIIVKAYDEDKYSATYEMQKLIYEIKNLSVQSKLRNFAEMQANGTYLSFEKSLSYKNNKFYNSTDYGDYYEQFICTPEQYQVMADFIDYIQKNALEYYIKSIDDPNVEWKYVEDVVYKEATNELNITYKDNSDLNKNGSTKDCYSLTLSPKNEVTSPISDALDSIMAMLGVGEYGNNMYNTMERDDSGDFLNLVQWANEKCYIHFSDHFNKEVPDTWSDVDEILMYEYYRFSANNTLSDFTFEDLTSNDVNAKTPTLDVMQIVYRTYYPEADVYSSEKTLPCVLINGNYYLVEPSKTKTDKFGNALYEIVSQKELNTNVNVRYLDPSYSILQATADTATLKISSGFDINKRNTWTLLDEVLVYEYFKNSYFTNDLSKYGFDDLRDSGAKFVVYNIIDNKANVNEQNFLDPDNPYTTTTKQYACINGTFYQLTKTGSNYRIGNGLPIPEGSEHFLLDSESEVKSHYNYYLKLTNYDEYGFVNVSKANAESFVQKFDPITSGSTFEEAFTDLNINDANDSKYANFALQLSENFDYKNTDTWSYRDYFIFYLYIKYNIANSFESLKYIGIEGSIKKTAGRYCFITKTSNVSGKRLYFYIDEVSSISELNINTILNVEETRNNNNTETNENVLFVNYDPETSNLFKEGVETKVFKYSEYYSYYDVSTWKMVDLILNYFSSLGIINSRAVLESSGYGALKYEIKIDGKVDDIVYKFGSNSNFYCLSEKTLKNYKNINGNKMNISSIDEFLETDVIKFICTYNCLIQNSVISTYDQISETMFQNYENFVLDTKNLIDILVEDNIKTDITRMGSYTYTNLDMDKYDPSTWTAMDLAYYAITGRLQNTFSSNIIQSSDGKRYFVINNKALLITEGKYAGTLSEGDSTIKSKKFACGDTLLSFQQNYLDSIAPLLKSNQDLENLSSLNSYKYCYNPGKGMSLASYVYNPNITILDAIILASQRELQNKNYYFNVFTDGTNEYLNVFGNYIKITREASGIEDNITYNPKATFNLTNSDKVFTKQTETYKSFYNYNYAENGKKQHRTFSYLDCLIYAETGSVESTEYEIFATGGGANQYLFVNNKFIKITSDNKQSKNQVDNLTVSDTLEKKNKNIDYLYNNYYKKYVVTSAKFAQTTDTPKLKYKTTFVASERNTWSPIALILYKKGFISGVGSLEIQEGTDFKKSEDGSKTYFIYTVSNVIEGEKSIIIDITNLGYIDDKNPDDDTEIDAYKYLREYDSAILKLNVNLFTVIDNAGEFLKDDDGYQLDVEDIIAKNTAYADSSYDATIIEKNTLKFEFGNANNFNENDVSTWTWIDLIYYYLFDTKSYTGSDYYVYYSASNEYFVELTDGTNYYYIEFNNYTNNGTTFDLIDQTTNLTKNFVQVGTDILSYDPLGTNTTLAFVAYKITNKTSPALDKFEFTSNNTDKTFYYVRNVFTNKLCGIYKLNNGSSNIDTGETEDVYSYRTTNDNNVSDWSLFDFFVYYANGFTGNNVYLSKLKTIGVNQYFVIDSNYINLTALSKEFNGVELAVKKDGTNLVSTRSIKSVGFGDGETIFTGYQSPILIKSSSIADGEPIKEAVLKVKPSDDTYTNDNEIKNILSLDAELFKFSKDFLPSDYSTWKVSDLMMYYAFKNGFYQVDDATGLFTVEYNEKYIENNEIKTRTITQTVGSKNFQNFITIGGAPGYVFYVISTDEYGNSKSTKVINFSNKYEGVSGVYYNYDVFSVLYGRNLVNIVSEENTANNISVKMTEVKTAYEIDNTDVPSFIYSVANQNANVDFTFKDYYYFKFSFENLMKAYGEIRKNITSEDISEILNFGRSSNAKIKGSLNIKLSDNFKIDDISTWTVFDLIVVYEYSKEIEGNEFRDATFEDMSTIDNYFMLYGFGDGDPIADNKLILQINGNYYNVASYVEKVKPDDDNDLEYRLKSGVIKPSSKTGADQIISRSTIRSHTLKTLFQKVNYTLNLNYGITTDKLIYDFNENEKSFNYTNASGDRVYRRIYTNTESLYKADFSDPMFSKYTISPLVKQVSWPEKIMTGMQVMYPDLNWGTLIATDGWLDTLGEFTSAYANGQFISKNNSSNTTAAGLVLSEFFLSVSKEVSNGYGKYEYQTLFDEKVIKSLMLSLLGEENYKTLSSQATIFVEMFNSTFAKILDDIAEENEIEIIDGQVNNFTMCVYKSYLATVLLSSDIGEYLYTVATRVFAQYTIYESLATACGDYAGYYAYTTGQKDPSGKDVDSFKYATFRQLVKYENLTSGQASPVYTFNMKKVYEAYAKANSITLDYDPANFDLYYYNVYTYLNKIYESTYKKGKRISDKSDLYCFMFDAYYTMKHDIVDNLRLDMPNYLVLFKEYLDGTIDRWAIACDVTVVDTAKYIQNYKDYVKARKYAKMFTQISLMKFYMGKHYHDDVEEDEADQNFFEKIWSSIKDAYDTLFFGKTSIGILNQSLSSRYTTMLKKLKNLTAIFGKDDFDYSEDGSVEHWEEILEINDNLDAIIEETNNVRALPDGNNSEQNKTANGSVKKFINEYYDDALLALNNIKSYLSNYISAQKMIDRVGKASVTYALAQFGQNYVTDGFDFNIENRNYTFDANLSATRLAEYVYGGAYLKKYNVKPTYTSEDYTGIISESKTYDKNSGYMKTNLEMWPELRKFASELANYTSKLYYQTNLKNIAKNISDGVLLTDYVKADIYQFSSNSNYSMTATSEFLMLYYLINNSSIDVSTYVRLMFADTVDNFENMEDEPLVNYDNLKKLASALETGNWSDFTTASGDLNEDLLKGTLVDYLIYMFTDKYNSFGYYNSGDTKPSERIHKVFKNVVSYLLVTEDSENAESENALNLEDLSFKDFKILLMEKIVEYQQNPSETAKENTARYLTIFELISSNYQYNASATDIGTVLRAYDLNKTDSLESETPTAIKYRPLADGEIYAELKLHVSTKNNILNLAGLANRPIEELVNLEYDNLYDRNGNYDEATGDVFVVCSYDELTGKYIPYLARSENYERLENSKYDEYLKKYGKLLKTDYYDDLNAYPIIAKGIFNSQGMPTAIKIVDNNVLFYRTTVLAAGTINEDSVQTTMGASQVNTVSYTKTVESTSYKKLGVMSGKATTFLGSIDMKTYVNSKVDPYFLQNEIDYNLEKDEYGGISVLEDFSAHYTMNGQTYFLLIMSFVTLVPFLFNASASVLRRILDLIFLILIGPLMISMKSLDVDDEQSKRGEKAFNSWKGKVTQALMSAFGYVLGFRIYYILVSSVLTMSFVSDVTLTNITRIGGISFLNKATVNALLRYLYVLAAVALIRSSANMILQVITARFGKDGTVSNMLASPLSGKEPLQDGIKDSDDGLLATYKKGMAKINNIASGQALLDMKNAAFEQVRTMIPGSSFIEKGADMAKGFGDRMEGRQLQRRLKDAGVDSKTASQAKKQFVNSRKEQRQNMRNRRVDSANNFMSQYVSEKQPFSRSGSKDDDKKKK